MSRSGHNIRVLKRGRNDSRRDQAADVRHVRQQVRAVVVGDLLHARVVDESRVGRSARNYQFGTVQFSILLHFIVVDNT